MSININSPMYYTTLFGVNEEIYNMCLHITKSIDIKEYTSKLDVIGITPIIAPQEELKDGKWAEEKKVCLPYRYASISLTIKYEQYVHLDIANQKKLIVKNIFDSLQVVKRKIGKDFDFAKLQNDILNSISAFL